MAQNIIENKQKPKRGQMLSILNMWGKYAILRKTIVAWASNTHSAVLFLIGLEISHLKKRAAR